MLSVWCLVPGNYPTARRLRPLRSLLEDRTIAEKSIDLILSRYLLPTNPLSPPWVFDFPVIPGIPYPVDPHIAIGYDYFSGLTGPLFASVTLPFVGDDLYTLDTTFGTFALAARVFLLTF